MNNYKDKFSDNPSPRGNRGRASFNPNFDGDNRLKSRPRFNKSDERPQYRRTNREDNNGGEFGSYKQYKRYGNENSFNRFDSERSNRGNDFEPRYGKDVQQVGRSYGKGANRGGYNAGNGSNGGSERPYANKYQSDFRPKYADKGNRKGAYDPSAKYSAKKRAAYREATLDPNAPVRLNKYLANAGICSRREADNYIEAGLITVNGVIVTELGVKVVPTDDVRFNSERINPERKVYVLLNKPKDCVTTVDDPQERKTVLDCLRGIGKERIYPVGRLDRNTTGVLLLTNDGDMAAKLTHPKFMKKKIYHVTCDKNVAMSDMDLLVNGIELEDGRVYADEVSYVNEADRSQIGIEIHSGKNRIVRRMLEHLGYRVNKLDRVLFAGLTKKNLRRGDWRYLTDKEINMLRLGAYE
ncbi:MAG: rRNA pseudouridine synthase [Bacteroidaceae bacterium]|nr:rRNA pseudouridine synthase [Bacteroidaceae bacterium]